MKATVCTGCRQPLDADTASCPSCDVARPRGGWPLHPHLGRVVGQRYRLLEVLGRGGTGEVYRARDESPAGELGEVVVKLLVGGAAGTVDTQRFLTEARAARTLTSPHVVKIFDFGFDDDGQPFLVMELLRGLTLRARLERDGPLDAVSAIELAEQIAEALAEAHAAGIVHRDLKPDNVMLVGADQRHVKVLDFGAARLAGPNATRSLIGTPRYMAPEQVRQEELDGRTDIYALGACLFELVAGRPAVGGATLADCLEAHLHGPPPRLRAAAPATPRALEALVCRMMARKPTDRPSSMEEVRGLLRAALAAAPRSGRRRRWLVLAAAPLVLLPLVLLRALPDRSPAAFLHRPAAEVADAGLVQTAPASASMPAAAPVAAPRRAYAPRPATPRSRAARPEARPAPAVPQWPKVGQPRDLP